MIYRGDCYWIDLPLPGTVGLGAHATFVFSALEANEANDYVLLGSSHRNARHPWAFQIVNGTHYRHRAASARPPFDADRMIGVEQMVAVSKADLPNARDGELSFEALAGAGSTSEFGADSAIRVQFALPGYPDDLRRLGWRPDDLTQFASETDAPQFSLWEADLLGERRTCVVVSNDKHNTFAQHVQVLEIATPAEGECSRDVGHADGAITLRMRLALRPGNGDHSLQTRTGDLAADGRSAVVDLLAEGLGLTR